MSTPKQNIFTKYPINSIKNQIQNIESIQKTNIDESNTIKEQKTTLQVEDFIQDTVQLQNYSFLKDIGLGLCFYLFYINVPSYIFTKTLKILLLVLIFRYILSILTTYKSNIDDSKKYFQFNSHIAFMYILILSLIQSDENLSFNNKFYIYYTFLAMYVLLIIGSQHIYTTDAISTLILTYSVFNYLNKNL